MSGTVLGRQGHINEYIIYEIYTYNMRIIFLYKKTLHDILYLIFEMSGTVLGGQGQVQGHHQQPARQDCQGCRPLHKGGRCQVR